MQYCCSVLLLFIFCHILLLCMDDTVFPGCLMQAAEMLHHNPCVKVIPVEADEAHMTAAKATVKQSRKLFSMLPYSA